MMQVLVWQLGHDVGCLELVKNEREGHPALW